MRFLRLTTTYESFARAFARETPGLEKLSYGEGFEQFESTLHARGAWEAFHLRALGHEAEVHYLNLEPLQRAWAREHGVAWEESRWREDIAAAQVRVFRPEVIYLEDLYLCDRVFRDRLRLECPPGTIFVGWRAAPTDVWGQFADLDLVLTAVPHFLEPLRAVGVRAELLPLAFEPALLEKLAPLPPRDLAFTFAGNAGLPRGPHSARFATLAHVASELPLELWSELAQAGTRTRLGRVLRAAVESADTLLDTLSVSRRRRAAIPGVNLGLLLRLVAREPERFHRPVFGREYLLQLARTCLAFNQHIDVAGEYAANLRLYEATGLGACLVTDWKKNLCEIFEIDREVVAYRSAEECVEKVRRLLERPDEARAIAKAGQRRTLRDHTLRRRIEREVELVLRLRG